MKLRKISTIINNNTNNNTNNTDNISNSKVLSESKLQESKNDKFIKELYSTAYIMTTTIDVRTDNILEPREMLMFLPIYTGNHSRFLNKKKQEYKECNIQNISELELDSQIQSERYLSNKSIDSKDTVVLNIKYNDYIRGIPKTFTGMKNTAIVRIVSNGKPATINIGGNNVHICGSKSEKEAQSIVSNFTKVCTYITKKLIILKLSDVFENREILSNPETLVNTIYKWRCDWYDWIYKILYPKLLSLSDSELSDSELSEKESTVRQKYKNENIIIDFMNKHEEIILLPSEYKELIEKSPHPECADYLLCFLPEFTKKDLKLYIQFIHKVLFVSNINTRYGFIYFTTYLLSILQVCQDLFSNVKFPMNRYEIPEFHLSKTELYRLSESTHYKVMTKSFDIKNYGINIVKYRSTLFRCKYNVGFMINKTKLFHVINERERYFRVLNYQDNQQSKITIYLPIEDYSYDFISVEGSDNSELKDLQDTKLQDPINENTNEESIKKKKHNIRRHAFEVSHDGMINQSSPSQPLGDYACKRMIQLLFKYYDEIKL
jgi:hypothetical protein